MKHGDVRISLSILCVMLKETFSSMTVFKEYNCVCVCVCIILSLSQKRKKSQELEIILCSRQSIII